MMRDYRKSKNNMPWRPQGIALAESYATGVVVGEEYHLMEAVTNLQVKK